MKYGNRVFIKKGLQLLLLLLGVYFVIANRSLYLDKGSQKTSGKLKYEVMSIAGQHEIVQRFHTKYEHLTRLNITFHMADKMQQEGALVISIRDTDGNTLTNMEYPVADLRQTMGHNDTNFDVDVLLKKDEDYDLVLTTKDVKDTDVIGVYTAQKTENEKDYSDLTMDGEKLENQCMRCKQTYTFVAWKSLFIMLMLLAVALIIVLLPLHRLSDVQSRWIGRILFLGTPFAAYALLERLNGNGILSVLKKILSSMDGRLNVLILMVLLLVFYALLNRTTWASGAFMLFVLIFGMANFFVDQFRDSPLTIADLYSVGTAAEVAGGYTYNVTFSLIYSIIYALTFLSVLISIPSSKGFKWKYRVLPILLAAAGVFGIKYMFFDSSFLKDHGIRVSSWAPSSFYEKHGTALSFMVTWTYNTIEKPDNYSVSAVEEIESKYESDPALTEAEEKQPNLIVIMDEAFSDLSVVGDLPVSEDYLPFIHGLTEDTIKGRMHVSVFGGNTVNSEFEYLTGASMAFLPYKSVPYNTLVKSPIPGWNTTLADQAYGSMIAWHPYPASGYGRDRVYPLLGFDTFLSKPDIDDLPPEDIEYLRANFLSDESDFKMIIRQYEQYREQGSDKPFYLFNVTMQNHGGFDPNAQGSIPSVVEITDEDAYDEQGELYLNLIKRTDMAFEMLVNYFREQDEPTVIVLFGDHQPALHTSFWNIIQGSKASKWTKQQQANRYITQFVVWANYDIEEEENLDISANYLGAFVLDKIGARMTGFQKFLLDLREKIPFVSADYYMGDDGVLHTTDEESEYSELLNTYQILQYNLLVDKANRVESFFNLKQ